MRNKKALAILIAAAMAGSAIQPVAAQGYYGGGYNDPYNQYGAQPSYQYGGQPSYPYGAQPNYQYGPSYPDNTQYGNRYNNQYDADRDRYERDRAQSERERNRYQRRAARFDRNAYFRTCEQQRQGNTAGGAIAGAIAGGLLGNAISGRGDRGAGTALGAIFGGVVGASIASNLNCEDRSYAVDTYFNGFEAGVPNRRYNWRSPRSGASGYLQVRDYYQDPRGMRCANYAQEIYVRGRPELAQGYACRQPDGTWQLVG